MATQQQINFFQENGYLKFGKVLDSDGVEAMRAGLDAIIELELTEGDESSPEFKYGHDRHDTQLDRRSGHPRAIHQYVNMWKREPRYEAAIHHPLIAGTARALLDTPEVRLWHDQVISKPPPRQWTFRIPPRFLLLAPESTEHRQLLVGFGRRDRG